jgi:hypothetical protein
MIEMFGGRADGVRVTVDRDALHRTYKVPVPPTSPVRRVLATGEYELAEYEVLTYEWDGTVNQDGVHRFRWSRLRS